MVPFWRSEATNALLFGERGDPLDTVPRTTSAAKRSMKVKGILMNKKHLLAVAVAMVYLLLQANLYCQENAAANPHSTPRPGQAQSPARQ